MWYFDIPVCNKFLLHTGQVSIPHFRLGCAHPKGVLGLLTELSIQRP